jgi:hypothetical protein
VILALLLAAATPPDAAPGFSDSAPPAPVFARPKHDAPLDPTIAQQVIARLVQLHLLDSAADAQDARKAADAVRGFQASAGLKPTGVLDRKTLALMAL